MHHPSSFSLSSSFSLHHQEQSCDRLLDLLHQAIPRREPPMAYKKTSTSCCCFVSLCTRKFSILLQLHIKADSVKARLQQYGYSGSHLDIGNSLTSATKDGVNVVAEGPGLFREVFSRGYSVVFQCAQGADMFGNAHLCTGSSPRPYPCSTHLQKNP